MFTGTIDRDASLHRHIVRLLVGLGLHTATAVVSMVILRERVSIELLLRVSTRRIGNPLLFRVLATLRASTWRLLLLMIVVHLFIVLPPIRRICRVQVARQRVCLWALRI